MADTKVSDLPALNGVDVDPADLLYIVDSSAGAAGSKKITVGQYQVAPYSAGTANGVMYLNGSNVVTTGSGLVFDGSNLGVGTSSPTTKLDISSNSTTTLRVNRLGVADVYLTAGANGIYGLDTASTNLHFGVSNSLKMTLDSFGNLGLGVTPSAWNSTSKAIQIKDFVSVSQQANGAANFGFNFYEDAANTFKYSVTDEACRFSALTTGGFGWFTATSGTAGNAISFGDAKMTLDASGNLGVGTTSPAAGYKTTIAGSSAWITAGASFTIEPDVASGANGVDLKTSFAAGGNGPLKLWTGGFERARITSGGDLLVGRTTNLNSNRFLVSAPDLVAGVNVENGTGEAYRFYSNTTAVGTITVTGSATAYNTSSDQRLKKNIQDAPAASDLIDAIQVRSFDWIADDSHQRYGMVAQELAQVAPEAVYEPADHDEMMAVDYSKLVPMLIKEIQSLRARVAALEAQ